MIIIHPLRICYSHAPKLASTSIFSWFYELLHDRPFSSQGGNPVHAFFVSPRPEQSVGLEKSPIQNVPLNEFSRPEGYYVFTITRDPVARLMSAWRNRVTRHHELAFAGELAAKLEKHGLRANPQLDYFVQHLETYRKISKSIKHHTDPMVNFIGSDLAIYDRIYDLSELAQLERDLVAHWQSNGICLPPYALKQLQVGGVKATLEDLSQQSLAKLLDFYKQDYELFNEKYSPAMVQDEWRERRNSVGVGKPFTNIKVKSSAKATHDVVKMEMFKVPQLTDDNGVVSGMAGIVVPQATLEQGRIVVIDADGELHPRWLESPVVASALPDNPHGRHAKFATGALRVTRQRHVEVFWERAPNDRVLLWQVIAK